MRLGARAGHALFAVAAVLVGALLGGYVAGAMKTRRRRRGDPGPGPR